MIDGGKTNVLGQMDSLTETSLSEKNRTKIGTFNVRWPPKLHCTHLIRGMEEVLFWTPTL